jgi:anthranilate/para-aminobenzoate synthase component I
MPPRYASAMLQAHRLEVANVASPPLDPASRLSRWPRDRPVALMHAGMGAETSARWSVMGTPSRVETLEAGEIETLLSNPLSGAELAVDAATAWIARSLGANALGRSTTPAGGRPPFSTGRLALLAYELGAILEPAARDRHRARPRLGSGPLAFAASLENAQAFDHAREVWWRIGESPCETEAPDGEDIPVDEVPWSLSPLRPDRGDAAFEANVRRCVDLIHDGDLFQANLAERFTATLDGSPRDLAAAALRRGSARFGGYVEISPDLAVLSLSPELFLATGAWAGSPAGVVTCPIKGTRPAGADLDAFAADPKDAAELAMIVDLMRNDLGRVCRPGSVRVVDSRRFETHPTVVHGVAEVRGELREGTDLAALLAATFPPGSVTGAPKIRAMQVIDELEPSPREAYCGSLGWIDDRHGLVLNVAIRTAVLRRDRLAASERWQVEYHAGCGIVADSDPDAESEERLDKTAVLARWTG